jgi:hypothetical protein
MQWANDRLTRMHGSEMGQRWTYGVQVNGRRDQF